MALNMHIRKMRTAKKSTMSGLKSEREKNAKETEERKELRSDQKLIKLKNSHESPSTRQMFGS